MSLHRTPITVFSLLWIEGISLWPFACWKSLQIVLFFVAAFNVLNCVGVMKVWSLSRAFVKENLFAEWIVILYLNPSLFSFLGISIILICCGESFLLKEYFKIVLFTLSFFPCRSFAIFALAWTEFCNSILRHLIVALHKLVSTNEMLQCLSIFPVTGI